MPPDSHESAPAAATPDPRPSGPDGSPAPRRRPPILESSPASIQSVLRKISREPGPFGLNQKWDDLTPRQRGLARLGAAMLCAACMVLGSPDYDQWYLAFVGWIFWLAAIEGLAPRKAFWVGWACGIATVFFGFFWLTELLLRFADFPMWATLLVHFIFAAFQGLQWAAPAALLNWLRRRTGRDVLLLAPLCWVAGEALLPHIFPSYLALMWCWQPLWLQVAEIGGVTTIGLVQLLINAGLYVALRDWLRGKGVNRRALLVAGITFVATPIYGAIRMAQIDATLFDTRPIAAAQVEVRQVRRRRRVQVHLAGLDQQHHRC